MLFSLIEFFLYIFYMTSWTSLRSLQVFICAGWEVICAVHRRVGVFQIAFWFLEYLQYFFERIPLKDYLTLSRRRMLLYRNHSIDLRSKSMDWFLYDNGLRLERVKKKTKTQTKVSTCQNVEIPTLLTQFCIHSP